MNTSNSFRIQYSKTRAYDLCSQEEMEKVNSELSLITQKYETAKQKTEELVLGLGQEYAGQIEQLTQLCEGYKAKVEMLQAQVYSNLQISVGFY